MNPRLPDVPEESILEALGGVGRVAMLQHYTRDSCVAATRIVVETLDAFGIDALAVPVQARIFNPPLAEWQRGDRSGPAPEGAYEVDLGMVESEPAGSRGRTAGGELHLVAVTDQHMVDLSLDQASRPDHALSLEASSFVFNDGQREPFLAGSPLAWHSAESGILYAYQVRVGVTWWQEHANWGPRDASIRSHVVGAVIRALRRPETPDA